MVTTSAGATVVNWSEDASKDGMGFESPSSLKSSDELGDDMLCLIDSPWFLLKKEVGSMWE